MLETYEYRCALCEHSCEFPRKGHWPTLEAAHIQWHSHQGPNVISNGVALCVIHHELFDWGGFTLQPDSLEVLVSPSILKRAPNEAFMKSLADFNKKPLPMQPRKPSDRPASDFLNWHDNEVFRNF